MCRELALSAEIGFERALRLVFREAWLQGALLFLGDFDALRRDEHTNPLRCLLELLAADRGITILAGTQRWVPAIDLTTGVVEIAFTMPSAGQRRSCWEDCLAAEGLTLGKQDAEVLAGRFRLSPGQIAEAAATCRANTASEERPARR